jgi:hypothetical protein
MQAAKLLDTAIHPTLSLLEDGLEMRCSDEVVSRMLAMHAVAAVAFGFDRQNANSWLRRESLIGSLCIVEKSFLLGDAMAVDRFRTQIEGIWALAWAMGVVKNLDFGKDCDDGFVNLFPNLKHGESSAGFRRRVQPRPVGEVVAACDLAYCLHWAIRESELTGKRPSEKLKAYVVVERRQALEWQLTKDEWDAVSLDT